MSTPSPPQKPNSAFRLHPSSFRLSPSSFQFTQSKLQDYLTCPRRFELRYQRKMNWPAVETAPLHEAERRMQLGSDFHRLAHQHALGLPARALSDSARHNPELAAMWQNYLEHRPAELAAPNAQLFPETTLAISVSGYRLAAKYDLLAYLPGDSPRILIVDWKTNLRRPPSSRLRARAQTRVYPFVLATLAGGGQWGGDGGQQLLPEQITFQYFFTAAPTQPEIILYSQGQFEADRRDLNDLIQEIAAAKDFPLTPNERACRFCVYRSFCNRGDVAGDVDEFEGDLLLDEFDLNWEQVSEVAY